MGPTRSGGQHLVLGSDHLTLAPGRVKLKRPERSPEDTERARRSSAIGTNDDYCHIFVGSAPYRYTSCGLRLDRPIPVEETHAEPPCPNGNLPCPDCVRVRTGGEL